MFRFSLTTLILAAFWIAALLLVWTRREPWVITAAEKWEARDGFTNSARSPDQSRLAATVENGVRIYDANAMFPGGGMLLGDEMLAFIQLPDKAGMADWLRPANQQPRVIYFLNDDALAVSALSSQQLFFRCHRRFPEWWWGHFYRPEIWLAFALTGALCWRGVKAWRARRAPEAAP